MITSRKNPLIKELAKLAQKPAESVLAEGFHLVREAINARLRLEKVLVTPAAANSDEGRGLLGELSGCEIIELSPDCYGKITRLKSPEGMAVVFARPVAEMGALFDSSARLVVAAGVQDPGNAGAIVRVAEAAGARGCVFLDGVDPWGGRFMRAAMGSSFRLPCLRMSAGEFVRKCGECSVRMLAANYSEAAGEYTVADFTPPVAICVGSEGRGVSPEVLAASKEIFIPMAGKVESLNVSVACGIILYHANTQWQ